jgi:hypothetical protein
MRNDSNNEESSSRVILDMAGDNPNAKDDSSNNNENEENGQSSTIRLEMENANSDNGENKSEKEMIKTITEEEIAGAVQHDDYVVYDAYFNFDVHNITGSGLDETGCQKKFTQKKGYTIPYGCLIPEEIDGLLLSGRNISGTHMAHSNFRAMPICMGIGEAAGVAAALSVKQGKKLRDVDVKDIQMKVGK